MQDARFGNLMNLFMNIAVGIALGITGQIINGAFSIMGFLQGLVLSIAIGFFIGTWIPLNAVSKKCAGFLKIKEGIGEYVVSCVVMAVIMVTLICLGCTFVQAGAMFLFVFMKLFLPFVIVCIFTLLIVTVPIGILVQKIMKK